MVGTERARRDEDVGVGFTSIGFTDKKLGGVFCQGPICKKNIFKQGLERKTETYSREYVSFEGKLTSSAVNT